MGGHRVVPSADEHFYCATKYAVTALTEGIRQELREANTRIRATVSCVVARGCCSYIGWHNILPSPSNESARVSAHERDALRLKSFWFFFNLPLQCISPGIVETEFAFRHHNSDPEKAAAVYESMKVSEHRRLTVNKCVSQSRRLGNTSSLHFPVFKSRRHSQRSHIRVKCPCSRPGTPLSSGLTIKCISV